MERYRLGDGEKMKKWMSGILAVMIVAILVGCSETEQTNSNGKELEEISIMLDWYPNAVHSAIYVAEEKGYFRRARVGCEN